jgi:hypothetical protein
MGPTRGLFAIVFLLAICGPILADVKEDKGLAKGVDCDEAQARGVAFFAEGKFEESTAAFFACPDWVYRPQILANIGFASLRAGDQVSAVAAFLRAWSLAPLNSAVAQGFVELKASSPDLSPEQSFAGKDATATVAAALAYEPWRWQGSSRETFVWHSYRFLSHTQWIVFAIFLQCIWLILQGAVLFLPRLSSLKGLARVRRLIMVLAFCLLGVVLIQQGHGSLGMGAVKIEAANLLSNPSQAGVILGTAEKAQGFRVVAIHEDWLRIQLSSGLTGWVERSQVLSFHPTDLDAS